ncbi:class I SAM-dependent methyltransferase [Actinomadura keratinilytica]|uniref:Class I SAM-dependent methyltransferase n=1 Tax=Actinomadura keratinilytica TaxID=547461 RepID=A0ABP7Z2V0_9ACTN
MRLRSIMLLTAAGFTADALWRRARAAKLTPLTPPPYAPHGDEADTDAEAGAEAGAEGGASGGHRFVTAEGVHLDDAIRRAAAAHARRHGLRVLDLVPSGLDSLRALELVRRVDPAAYRWSRLAVGGGGAHAVLVDADVAERAGISRFDGLSPAEMDELITRLKCYAPTATDLCVAPGIAPVGCPPADRRRILRRRWPSDLPVYLTGNILGLGVLGAALARCLTGRGGAPGRDAAAALAVLAAACAQPYLATAGTPLRPCDRLRFALTRPVAAPLRWLRVAAQREDPDPRLPALRAEYAADLAQGVDRFFEERRADCPWCGGRDLRRLLACGDRQHHRPGRFVLERCGTCGHVFQNPRLNAAGLDFYYRDFYDGSGGPEVERGFRLAAPHYRDRAKMLRGHAEPRAWLDVGAGHGHFCNAARDIWPHTRFDGLDMGVSIQEAERRGWVDRAYQGLFPDLADKLAGEYDVVSMHHYLEHTVDPRAELDAAARVLPPGGHLLIEVPDPEWPLGRLARGWWHAWFQPQHLHFVTAGNLVRVLEERGFRVVAVERGPAHQPVELLMIVMLLAHRIVPDPGKPWRDPRVRRLRGAARTAVFVAAGPLMFAAAAADQLLLPVIRRGNRSNAYRVLARRVADGARPE